MDDPPQPAVVSAADVADYLRLRLRRGTLIAGQRIVEIDVVNDTGATRARVRQALQRLASEGLVSIEEYRGASVRRLGVAEMVDLYQLRAVNEGLAARLVAERGGEDTLAALSELQEEMNRCEADGDGERYGVLNDRWHLFLVEHCGSAPLAELVARLRLPVVPLQYDSFRSAAALRRSNAAHRAVTAAILARDGARAEVAMRAHVDAGGADIAAAGDAY